MSQENPIQDAEKAEEARASLQATACQDPLKPGSLNEPPTPPHGTQDAVQDLEELAPVRSGPAYSVFPKWKKRYIIAMVTWGTFVSPMSANIYFPALNSLQADLHVSSSLIKEVYRFGGSVEDVLPAASARAIRRRFGMAQSDDEQGEGS